MTTRPIGGTVDDVIDRIAGYHAQYCDAYAYQISQIGFVDRKHVMAWIMQTSKGTAPPVMVQSYLDGYKAGKLKKITLAATHRQAYDRGFADGETP